jgi:hypothetical protein
MDYTSFVLEPFFNENNKVITLNKKMNDFQEILAIDSETYGQILVDKIKRLDKFSFADITMNINRWIDRRYVNIDGTFMHIISISKRSINRYREIQKS